MIKKTLFVLLLLSQKINSVSKNNIIFLLYDQTTNKPTPIDTDDPLQAINPSYPTKVFIHGWHSSGTESSIEKIASLYHKKNNYNFISVDWSKDASGLYITSVAASRSVGAIIGDFFIKITQKSNDFLDKLHLIGHSLGGQVAGFAGARVFKKTGRKIDRITGLDAASPLFEIPVLRPKKDRLDKSDASFVDNIHTTSGVGYIGAYATADFYINEGGSQLNCSNKLPDLLGAVSCDHGSAQIYWAKTILEPKKYEGVKCEDVLRFNEGSCDGNPKAYMGDEVSRDARGKYFLKADRKGDETNV